MPKKEKLSFNILTQNTYIYEDMCMIIYAHNSVDLESSIKIIIPFFLINCEIPQQDLKDVKALKCQLIILSLI